MLLAEYGQVDDSTYDSDDEGNGYPHAGRDPAGVAGPGRRTAAMVRPAGLPATNRRPQGGRRAWRPSSTSSRCAPRAATSRR